jgi:hypothetical protein
MAFPVHNSHCLGQLVKQLHCKSLSLGVSVTDHELFLAYFLKKGKNGHIEGKGWEAFESCKSGMAHQDT